MVCIWREQVIGCKVITLDFRKRAERREVELCQLCQGVQSGMRENFILSYDQMWSHILLFITQICLTSMSCCCVVEPLSCVVLF
jgi:hypothetical protein